MLSCSGQTCATCRWWHRQGPQLANATRDPRALVEEGTCQAHGPFIVERAMITMSVFPRTHESRFCGDWAADDHDGGGGGERVVPFPSPANRIAA